MASFCFVTLSRPGSTGASARHVLGLGFTITGSDGSRPHGSGASAIPAKEDRQEIPKEEARQLIEARLAYVRAQAAHETQSRRGQIFEMLADLTDEDGALAEMDDLPDWLLGDE
jgi:hypothetical protein